MTVWSIDLPRYDVCQVYQRRNISPLALTNTSSNTLCNLLCLSLNVLLIICRFLLQLIHQPRVLLFVFEDSERSHSISGLSDIPIMGIPISSTSPLLLILSTSHHDHYSLVLNRLGGGEVILQVLKFFTPHSIL